jgi:hypothetical protein
VTVIQPGNTISVIVQYHVHGDSTLAFFGWPIAQPKDCYKISVKDIQIEFDAHIPARPTQVTLRNIQKTEHQQITLLERLFGEAFTHAMLHANRSGIAVMKLDLTLQNRRAIAQVQLEDACSPEINNAWYSSKASLPPGIAAGQRRAPVYYRCRPSWRRRS